VHVAGRLRAWAAVELAARQATFVARAPTTSPVDLVAAPPAPAQQ
jgi:hypothetical protein